MKMQPIVLVLFTLLEFLLLSNFTSSFDKSVAFDENPLIYTYNRFSEIQKECASFLSSASELKPDDSGGGYMLEQKLYFDNGEWEQESGDFSPLIPYEDMEMSLESTFSDAPLKLVSFKVKHVSTVHHSRTAISFRGLMRIGQARNYSLIYDEYYNFYMASGMSVLKIFFEGVYFENAGGSMVCMLGNTTLPFLTGDADPSGRIRKHSSLSNHKPRLFHDDHILLVLRYPKTFSLTRRSIQGEIRSLNDERSFKYFDPVHISSQLSRLSKYKFSSGELKSRTCDPYLYQDSMVEDGANMFDGSEFCNYLKYFSHDGFNIVPNWKYVSKSGFRNRIGPFLIEGGDKDLDWSYDNARMITQNIFCERDDSQEFEPKNARVAAVFRVFPSTMDRTTADTRNSLSAMTLSAEGTWDASTGQLCMVGCLGITDSGLDGCTSQISMYFPRSFSIKQRSVIVGSISSTVDKDSYVPILFGVSIRPDLLHFNHPLYVMSFLSYNHSKTELACAFREKNQPNKLIATIKKSLLTYPALQDAEQKHQLAQLDSLARNLYVGGFSVPYPPQCGHKPEIFVTIEVSSLGPLFGGYTEWLHKEKFPFSAQPEVSKSAVLNVSLHLMFSEAALMSEKSYKNMSGLSLEGLYDPLLGEMYLTGCRKVKAEITNTEIERGMDCSIEVNILYPSETFGWLKNPSTKISISSKRNKDDSLYFTTIRLLTFMTRHGNEEDAVYRKVVDEILRNLLFLVANMIILRQLAHIKKNVNAVPYISYTMLGFQAVGYILPLITHSSILFEPKDLKTKLYDLFGFEQLLRVLDHSSKVLSLTCLILTAQVSQKVSASRKSSSKLVTSERKVVFIMLTMLIFGFVILLLVCGPYTSVRAELEGFVAFVQNFFLLPQIIGNLLWQTRVKSLSSVYYFGFTLIRVLALVYGYIRDPIIDPYSMNTDEFMSLGSSSASKIGHFFALVAMVLLAARVHVQQNSSQQKLCHS